MAEPHLKPLLKEYNRSTSIQGRDSPTLTGEVKSIQESGADTSIGGTHVIAVGNSDSTLPSIMSAAQNHSQDTQQPWQHSYDTGREGAGDPSRKYVPSQEPPRARSLNNYNPQNTVTESTELLEHNHPSQQGWKKRFISLRNNISVAANWKCGLIALPIVLSLLLVSLILGCVVALPLYFTDPCSNINNHLAVFSTDTVLVADINPACNKAASVSLAPDSEFRQIVNVYETDSCSKLKWYDKSFSTQPKHYSDVSITLLVFDRTDDISNYLPSGAHLNVTINATVSTTNNSQLYICLFDDFKLYLDFKDNWKDNYKLAKRYVTHALDSTRANVITQPFSIEQNGYYFVAIATTAPKFDTIEFSYKGVSRYLNHSDYTYTNCELPDNHQCRPNSSCVLVYAEPLQPGEQDFSFIQVEATKLLTTAQKRYAYVGGPVVAVVVFVVLLIIALALWIHKIMKENKHSIPVSDAGASLEK